MAFGFARDYATYARWLNRADILPVTSRHDFFGCSVVEAMYCGVFPILPRRLAYPEHLEGKGGEGSGEFERCFYDDFEGLIQRLEWALANIKETRKIKVRERAARYSWDKMAPIYDREMEAVRLGLMKKG